LCDIFKELFICGILWLPFDGWRFSLCTWLYQVMSCVCLCVCVWVEVTTQGRCWEMSKQV